MFMTSLRRGHTSGVLDIRSAFIALAGLWLAASVATAQAPAMTNSNSPRSLIIIGASYAADWGTPPLPGFVITNKGVGGEESTAVRARFERDVIAARPDAVLIWGHINDIFRAPREQREQARKRAQENYRAMVESARAAGIEVILATEVTMTVGDSWIDDIRGFIGRLRGRENYRVMINDDVKDVNTWLRVYAARNQIRVLDFEKAVDGGNGSRREEFSTEDGSHISPEGYAALTDYARRQLTAR